MTVCGRCASFGSTDWTPNRSQKRFEKRRQTLRPRSDVEAAEIMDLVDNYGTLIREGRRNREWTVEDFAREIQEKESVVKKLEKEELNPDRKLIRKLESTLSIKLLEAVESKEAPIVRKPSTERTMADIWKIAQTREKKEKS